MVLGQVLLLLLLWRGLVLLSVAGVPLLGLLVVVMLHVLQVVPPSGCWRLCWHQRQQALLKPLEAIGPVSDMAQRPPEAAGPSPGPGRREPAAHCLSWQLTCWLRCTCNPWRLLICWLLLPLPLQQR